MKKIKKICEILENSAKEVRKLQDEARKQQEFEAYVKEKLDQISKDIAEIKRSII